MKTEKSELPKPPELVIKAVPESWCNGLPLGNGRIGVMCWRKENSLCFTIDHCDAWDLRCPEGYFDHEDCTYQKARELFDKKDFAAMHESVAAARKLSSAGPTKVYLGRLKLEIPEEQFSEFKLDLAEAVFKTGNVENSCKAFVSKHSDIFSISFSNKTVKPEYIPFYETSPGFAALGNPEVEIIRKNNLCVAVQQILPDKYFVLCWNEDSPEIHVSISFSKKKQDAIDSAINIHPNTSKKTWSELFVQHKQEWEKFWNKSAVSLPEPNMEFLWYYGIYLMASSVRRGETPPGLQGLWAMDGRIPPWRGDYHTDMNIQEYFWSACSANHLDLLDAWLDYMLKYQPKAEEYTRKVFGTEGAYQLCAFLPEYTPVSKGCFTPLLYIWSNTGWLAQLVWMRWQYSMDKSWLASTGYPIVKSAFLFYSKNLVMEDDGHYHIPLSASPEYEEDRDEAWCKDPNVDIALIRKCCDWIREMEEALGISECSQRAAEIHEKLVGYHLLESDLDKTWIRNQDKCVLGLWKDKLPEFSHRHPSHLMAIHPGMDITIDDGDEAKKIIEASLKHYLGLGKYGWAGHTYAQMISFAAVVNKPEMAYNFLRHFKDNWILPNSLHFNRESAELGNSHFCLPPNGSFDQHGQFTVNESCSITCGISDMLVQGWGGKIRIFPAIPSHWRNASFIDLLTEGAFLVSAIMLEGKIRWIRIIAQVEGTCKLCNPFEHDDCKISGAAPKKQNNLLTWKMTSGQQVELLVDGNMDTAG